MKRLAAKEMLYRQGDPGSTVYLVERGDVKISIRAGDAQLTVSRAGQGSLLGAIGAVDGHARAATATALSPCLLTAVSGGAFGDLLGREPAIRRQVLSILAANIRSTQSQLSIRSSQSTLRRVADRLIELTADEPGDDRQLLHLTQSALAEWIGATRESTARALAYLRRRGWITTGRGWIRVIDPDGLRRIVA